MAWTTPRTWVTGEIVTAALLNAQIKANMDLSAPAKLTTAGDMLYATGANATARLAKGTNGNILHQASCAPAWTATPSITDLTLSGALDVNGTIDYDGTCVDFLSSGDIDIVSSRDAACAIYIAQSTGTSGTVKIHADTGTSESSITILSDAGGINVDAATGKDIDVAGGTINLTSSDNAGSAIYLRANAGTSETIKIHSDLGTSVAEGAASVSLISDAGGVELRSTANLANAINLTVDSGTTSSIAIFNDTGNATGSICLKSDVGGITLNPATFVTVGGNATNAGEVRILEDTDNGSNYVAVKAPNVSTSYTITLPTAVAASCGLFLKSTCAGVTSWAAAGGGSCETTNGITKVFSTLNESCAFAVDDNEKFSMTMASCGEGFFFKVATLGCEESAMFFAEYKNQLVKMVGSNKYETLCAGATGCACDGKFYLTSDADSRVIWFFNREGNDRTVKVHGIGRLASVTAPACI